MALISVRTVHPTIRSAWRSALQAIDTLPQPLDWAWEARSFTATQGRPFIRESLRPIRAQKRAFGPGGITEHRLLGALTLFWPTGQGTGPVEDAAGILLHALQPGSALSYGGYSATILAAERSGLDPQPDRIACPVTFTILAHTTG